MKNNTIRFSQLKKLVKEMRDTTASDENDFVIKNGVLINYLGHDREIVIPEEVTEIDNFVFEDHDLIKKVILPSHLIRIGKRAFRFCSGINEITLPESLTKIEDEAFSFCSGLKTITIPANVKYIGNRVFKQCEGLTSLTILNKSVVLGDDAFNWCESLTSLKASKAFLVKHIYAFKNTGIYDKIVEYFKNDDAEIEIKESNDDVDEPNDLDDEDVIKDNGMKYYIVNYSVKVSKGSRNLTKLIETDDIRKYIKDNMEIGYRYQKGTKMFQSATEVVKDLRGYIAPKGGDYYYVKLNDFFSGKLVKSKTSKDTKYDWNLNKYF